MIVMKILTIMKKPINCFCYSTITIIHLFIPKAFEEKMKIFHPKTAMQIPSQTRQKCILPSAFVSIKCVFATNFLSWLCKYNVARSYNLFIDSLVKIYTFLIFIQNFSIRKNVEQDSRNFIFYTSLSALNSTYYV